MSDQGRIVSPGMKEDISSINDVRNTARSDVAEVDKLDTAVQKSSNDKRNTAPSQIEEGSSKSILTEIVEESNLSERINLAKSLDVHTPKIVSFRHPPM